MYPNNSGIRPVEFRVLIKPDPVEEVTAGGVWKPEKAHEMEQWAQVKGTLVAMGSRAFEDFSEDEREILIPGARVYYRKYEGIVIEGADGEEYRLCNDKDIGGVVENESAIPTVKARDRSGLKPVA